MWKPCRPFCSVLGCSSIRSSSCHRPLNKSEPDPHKKSILFSVVFFSTQPALKNLSNATGWETICFCHYQGQEKHLGECTSIDEEFQRIDSQKALEVGRVDMSLKGQPMHSEALQRFSHSQCLTWTCFLVNWGGWWEVEKGSQHPYFTSCHSAFALPWLLPSVSVMSSLFAL